MNSIAIYQKTQQLAAKLAHAEGISIPAEQFSHLSSNESQLRYFDMAAIAQETLLGVNMQDVFSSFETAQESKTEVVVVDQIKALIESINNYRHGQDSLSKIRVQSSNILHSISDLETSGV